MSDEFDPAVEAAVDLTERLRDWLRDQPETELEQAAALIYELAALIAKNAQTMAQVDELIAVWAGVMKTQIRGFGVGVEHP